MYLVTGATGVVGRPLLDVLSGSGAKVLAVSRDPNPTLPEGVVPVAPGEMPGALRGVTAVFVHPRAARDTVDSLLAAAREHDVGRVVVMSAINVDDPVEQQPSRYNGDRNREVERAVADSGLPWVSVRPTSFAMNTLTMWSGQIARGDTVFGPYAAFSEAVIHERDIAEVIAAAMTRDDLLGRRIALTGPEALRLDDMVRIIGAVIGRPLRYQEVPAEVAAQGMVQRGAAEPFVAALMARYAREIDRPALVTDGVATVLGRPARTFATWVEDHREAWS
ncbi:NAD(P)H-binding protein [Nocardia otitidiscaviarum]|uniref:NAD(P)H-binding protein n=1 Tax=Nocardia otitidiscaviarum TaxID=1823 RepID=UPI0004A713E8|nr:NAD(P)H-binding protein [Nocardia otitidiscaviarum]MBF6131678.1 NAD(P)H-binding protein [Nocardia otitidiscaviarum]MBF6482810.1 NAD(P)H-binding protein [Nocardia otitidiscaviarum]